MFKNKKIIYIPPPDKSITIRALVISSLLNKKIEIKNPLIAEDSLFTIKALKKLGCKINIKDKKLYIKGVGLYGFKKNITINIGQSALLLRLLLPILINQKAKYKIIGKKTIIRRNFKDTIIPFMKLGAKIEHNNWHLPLKIYPSKLDKGFFETDSAQLKSSLLIASLYKKNIMVKEKTKTRDHTENLLNYLGIRLKQEKGYLTVDHYKSVWKPKNITIYGDFSSAAPFITTATLTNREIIVKNCFINKRRIGFLDALKKTGCKIKIKNKRFEINEVIGDIYIKPPKTIKPIKIKDITTMIDETLFLSVVLSYAKGTSIISNTKKLKNKESNREKVILEILKKLGSFAYYKNGVLKIKGKPKNLKKIDFINSYQDHRVAMLGGVLKAINNPALKIIDHNCVEKTYPDFWKDLKKTFNVKI